MVQVQASYKSYLKIRDCNNYEKYQIPWDSISSISGYTISNKPLVSKERYVFQIEGEGDIMVSNQWVYLGSMDMDGEIYTIVGDRRTGEVVMRMSNDTLFAKKGLTGNTSKNRHQFSVEKDPFSFFGKREIRKGICESFSLLDGRELNGIITNVYPASLRVTSCDLQEKYIIYFSSLIAYHPQETPLNHYIFNGTREYVYKKPAKKVFDDPTKRSTLSVVLYGCGCAALGLFWALVSILRF